MAVPPLHDFMLPFLQRIADGSEHRLTELIEFLVKEFALSEDGLKVHSGAPGPVPGGEAVGQAVSGRSTASG